MSIWLFCLLMFLTSGPRQIAESEGRPPQREEIFSTYNVDAYAADSLHLQGYLETDSGYPSGPLVVCLPMMGHSIDSYRPFYYGWVNYRGERRLGSSEHEPLNFWSAMDMRGHGNSVVRKSDTVSFRRMSNEDFAHYPNDVRMFIESVIAESGEPIADSDITIVGASIGANTAALVTELMPNIKRIILLSPGLNYKGLQPAEAVKKFKGDILLVSSKEDEYSYQTVQELHKLTPEHSTLMLFEGDDHGTHIINNDPKAMKAVVDWLLDRETGKKTEVPN